MTPKQWNYDVDKMKSRLKSVYERYFWPTISHPEGDLVHFGDCESHRSMEVYKYAPCTCGLLHDLQNLHGILADMIFPQRMKDWSKQEAMVPGSFYYNPLTQEELEEQRKILAEIFPTSRAISPAPEEILECEKRDWALIEEVFGLPFCLRKELEWNKVPE